MNPIAARAAGATVLAVGAAHVGFAQTPAALPGTSPPCLRAMEALDAREAAAAHERSAAARAALQTARREAARACLGGPLPAASAARAPASSPPVSVPSAAASAAASMPRAPTPPSATAPLPAPAAPTTITACDATGCWTSAGTRLQRTGPDGPLLGPTGFCTVQGAVVQCPK